MSDAMDAVAEALARAKKHAAGLLARRQELEADLAKWRGERARLDQEDAGNAAVAAVIPEVDRKIADIDAELATVHAAYHAALTDIEDVRKLAGQARIGAARAVVASATDDTDPFIRSDEDLALDNARAHIRDQEARVRLNDELAPPRPAAPAPASPRPTQADVDADARRAFDELRARRQQPPGSPSTDAGSSPTPPTPTPPKKTF